MNIIKNRKQWHIYLIVVAILILSAASWFSFAKNLASTMLPDSAEKQETNLIPQVNTGSMTIEDNRENNHGNLLATVCNSLDKTIDYVKTTWNVFKQPLFSKIDSTVTFLGTGEIQSVQVVGGTNGWLFYSTKTDGNPIEDYEGTNSYTEEEMTQIYNAAYSVQKMMEDKGIKFAILVPPNKENIYSEYMPDTYTHSPKSRTDILISYLSDRGINIVSPKADMLDSHDAHQLYYSYDTHWNQQGAYIGVKDTLQSWGIAMPELDERTVSASELKNNYHICAQDDLANILGMRSVFSDDVEFTVDGTKSIDWYKYENGQNQYNDAVSVFHNAEAVMDSKILLIGDSFIVSAIPSLSEQFSDVYVVHRANYKPEMIDEISPDYVIAEYVERLSPEMKQIADTIAG